MKTFSGLIGPALIMIISGAVFVESFSYDIRDRFWPQGLSIIIILLCIPLIIKQLKKKPQQCNEGEKIEHAHHLVWSAIILTILYLFAAEWLGYFICTTFLMFALLFVLGERSKIMLAVLPVGTMLIIYGVFYMFLRIPLPTGVLF